MPLILRKNLTEPLTHSQLDGNFEYVHLSEWKPQAYEVGKPVYIKSETDPSTMLYICVKSHTATLYPGGHFVQVDTFGNRYWLPMTGGEIGEYLITATLLSDNITLRVIRNDGLYYDVNLSNHYDAGLTSHQLLKLTSADLPSSGTTYTLTYLGELARTDNSVVIDLPDADDTKNYFLVLPNGNNTTAGAKIKILLKDFQSTNPNKKLYIKSVNSGNHNRLLATNLNMYVAGQGYFLPLEIMEIVDIMWDGNDWIITNYIKQEYVSALASAPIII